MTQLISADTLTHYANMIWALRDEIHETWPTPELLDALRFSYTESAEILDAWLRLKKGYARNNIKEPDIIGECMDAFIMLVTAWGRENNYHNGYSNKFYHSFLYIDDLCRIIGEVYIVPLSSWRNKAIYALQAIDIYLQQQEINTEEELQKRINRLRTKHGGKICVVDTLDAST